MQIYFLNGKGIIGKEGNQAALNSDYYFGQFRFLWRLLFVHGRWNLFRTSYFVNYFFLKNFIFTVQQFFFGLYCAYSGQTFWDEGYLLNFNSLATALAPVYYAAFEQDVNPCSSQYIKKYLPRLYQNFRQMDLFSFKQFFIVVVKGTLLSFIIFFSVLFATYNVAISQEGMIDGLWYQSVLSYFCTVSVVWAINFMDTKYFSVLTFFAYGPASFLILFPAFILVWDLFTGPLQYMILSYVSNLKFWLTLFLNVMIVSVAKYSFKVYTYLIKPRLLHDLEYHWNKEKKKNDLDRIPYLEKEIMAQSALKPMMHFSESQNQPKTVSLTQMNNSQYQSERIPTIYVDQNIPIDSQIPEGRKFTQQKPVNEGTNREDNDDQSGQDPKNLPFSDLIGTRMDVESTQKRENTGTQSESKIRKRSTQYLNSRNKQQSKIGRQMNQIEEQRENELDENYGCTSEIEIPDFQNQRTSHKPNKY